MSKLNNKANEHQRKVLAQMKASSKLQAKLAALDSELKVIAVKHFTEMLNIPTLF